MLKKSFNFFKMKRMKRGLCITFAGIMTLGLCGCGRSNVSDDTGVSANSKELPTESKIDEAKTETVGTRFVEVDFNSKPIDGAVDSSATQGDYLYVSIYKKIVDQNKDAENSDETPINHVENLYAINVKTGDVKALTDYKNGDAIEFGVLSTDSEGVVHVIKKNYKDEIYTLCKCKDGEIIDEADMSSWNNNKEFLDNYILFDKNENIFMKNYEEIKIIDKDMNEILSKHFTDTFVQGVVNLKDGDIAVVTETIKKEHGEDTTLYIIGTDTYEIKKEIRLEKRVMSNSLMNSMGDYDFLYGTESEIFGYNIANETSTKIVDIDRSGIYLGKFSSINMVDTNTLIVGSTNNEETDIENMSAIFTKYSNEGVPDDKDVKVITYATISDISNMKKEILEFNKSQDDYMIKMVNYREESDSREKLSADIDSGNYPDIYEISGGLGDISMNQALEWELFEDLTPYIEGDEEIDMEDIIPSVRSAMNIDDKCYFLSSSFNLYTLVGKKSDVGIEPGWSYEEMKEYCLSKDNPQLFNRNSKTDILNNLLIGCGYDFIDWKNGESKFDNTYFKDILEIANIGSKDNPDQVLEKPSVSKSEDFLEGRRLFVDGDIKLASMVSINELFKGDYTIKGYPSSENSGTFIELPSMVAISSHSKNKDVAWEFVRRLLTKEYQESNYDPTRGEPTRKDVYEEKCETFRTENPGVDEEIELFNDAVENASGLWSNDEKIQYIIDDEAAAYFAGEKTVDEVAKIIEEKVNAYINENK